MRARVYIKYLQTWQMTGDPIQTVRPHVTANAG